MKRLDDNYSTPELGLGLGVSVKTTNFPDKSKKSAFYTHNLTRIDGELRAEAMDHHERQPYSVLVGILFLPWAACDDHRPGGQSQGAQGSSFCLAVNHFRKRSGRKDPVGMISRFERFYVALYDGGDPGVLPTRFFDVDDDKAPPRARRLRDDEGLSFDQLCDAIRNAFEDRNRSKFTALDD